MPELVYLDLLHAINIGHLDMNDDASKHPQLSRMVPLPLLQSFRIQEHATTGGILFLHTVLPLSCLLEVCLLGGGLTTDLCNTIIAHYCLNVRHKLAHRRNWSLNIGLDAIIGLSLTSEREYNPVWGVETKKQGFGFLRILDYGCKQLIEVLSQLENVLPSVATLWLRWCQAVDPDVIPYLREC